MRFCASSSFALRASSILLPLDLMCPLLNPMTLMHTAPQVQTQPSWSGSHSPQGTATHRFLEPPQGILDRLAFLQSNFGQIHHPRREPHRTYRAYSLMAR